jgi:putative flippase GtrA
VASVIKRTRGPKVGGANFWGTETGSAAGSPSGFWGPTSTEPLREKGRLRERVIGVPVRQQQIATVIGFVAIFGLLLYYFEPRIMLTATTTTGGDTGAHIYAPWYLKTHLLPKGLIEGWSPGWFAGFPMFQFYFPLVALFQALVSYVMPYQVAFKLGTILGIFFLPVAVYIFFRLLRLRFPTPLVGAIFSLGFLFMQSFSIYGGNIASSLAGEYGYALSLALSLVFAGLAYRLATEERGRPLLAAGVLAVTVLAHIVPVIAIAVMTPLLLFWAVRRFGWARALRRFTLVYGIALALTAVWSIPFVARIGYTPDMNWIPLSGSKNLFPAELRICIVAAGIACLLALVRRDRRPLMFLIPALMGFAFYFALPQGHLWNGRFLPHWYLGIFMLAAYLVGTSAPSLLRSFSRRAAELGTLALIGVLILGSVWLLHDKSATYVDDWINQNYKGYEAMAAYPEFKSLLDTVKKLPPGRIMWEESNDWGNYGTPDAPMAFPYFTGHPSMEGLYYESSITTPFHFLMGAEVSAVPPDPIPGLPYRNLDFTDGLEHMKLFDVRYYITITPDAEKKAQQQNLKLIDHQGPFSIFAVPSQGNVVIPKYEPVVLDQKDWTGSNISWFNNPRDLQTPLVADGPSTWARLKSIDQTLPLKPVPGGGVGVPSHMTDDSISFTTSKIGTPHWIKTSYFPNWHVEGARGPYMASPSLMLVIPTQHHVTLTYKRTWAEWLGLFLTLAALALLIVPWSRRALAHLADELGSGDGVASTTGTRPATRRRVATFAAVSVFTTLIDFGLFNVLLKYSALSVVVATTISYSAGGLTSYWFNKRYTFEGGGRDNVRQELVLFFAINVVGLALNNLMVIAVAHAAGRNALLLNGARIVAGAATWVFKYFAFRRWVYPTRAVQEPAVRVPVEPTV